MANWSRIAARGNVEDRRRTVVTPKARRTVRQSVTNIKFPMRQRGDDSVPNENIEEILPPRTNKTLQGILEHVDMKRKIRLRKK